MTDRTELERRLRAADPAGPAEPGWATRLQDLVEATVSTTADDITQTPGEAGAGTAGPPRRRPRWLVAAAAGTAAAVLAAIGVAGVALRGEGDPAPPPAVAKPAVLDLALPGEDGVMASCLAFSEEALAPMPVAFAGTVVSIADGVVRLEVDRWYRGGTADAVTLTAPDGESTALLGSVRFVEGVRYLVTATDGVVNSCGFTMEWSGANAQVFERAFGG